MRRARAAAEMRKLTSGKPQLIMIARNQLRWITYAIAKEMQTDEMRTDVENEDIICLQVGKKMRENHENC